MSGKRLSGAGQARTCFCTIKVRNNLHACKLNTLHTCLFGQGPATLQHQSDGRNAPPLYNERAHDIALRMFLAFSDEILQIKGRAASPKLRHVKFEDRSFPSTRVPHRSLPPSRSSFNVQPIKMTSALLMHCSSHCQLAFAGSTPRHEVRRAPIRTALRAAACEQAGEQAFDWRKAAAATALSASLCLSGPAW